MQDCLEHITFNSLLRIWPLLNLKRKFSLLSLGHYEYYYDGYPEGIISIMPSIVLFSLFCCYFQSCDCLVDTYMTNYLLLLNCILLLTIISLVLLSESSNNLVIHIVCT